MKVHRGFHYVFLVVPLMSNSCRTSPSVREGVKYCFRDEYKNLVTVDLQSQRKFTVTIFGGDLILSDSGVWDEVSKSVVLKPDPESGEPVFVWSPDTPGGVKKVVIDEIENGVRATLFRDRRETRFQTGLQCENDARASKP